MSIPLALSYLGLNRQGRQLYKASMPTTTVRAVCSIQGPSWQNGYFKLTLTDKICKFDVEASLRYFFEKWLMKHKNF